MKVLLNLVLVFIALIIQIIIPPEFVFLGVRPDLLLIVSVIIGLSWGIKDGIGIGFAAGMIQGLFLGGISGIYTFVKTLIGGLSGFVEKLIFKDKYIIPPFIIFFFTIIHETLIILLSEKFLFKINYFSAFLSTILPEAVLNAVIGFFIYFIYYKICHLRGNYHE